MAELKNNQPFQFDSQQEEIHQTPDSFKVFVSPGDRLKKNYAGRKIRRVSLLSDVDWLIGCDGQLS